jgi:hypothetical protein
VTTCACRNRTHLRALHRRLVGFRNTVLHRLVSDVGYLGGADAKRTLLALETAA